MKTKKLLFGLFAITLVLLFSCENNSEELSSSQNLINDPTITSKLPAGGPCPDGMVAVLSYEFDSFHFHRPKKNCESGFWFCTKGGEWVVNCVSNPKGKIYSSISETTTTVAAIIDRENESISFHFPIELINKNGNTINDFETFNVDEELEFGDVTLIIGDYPSTFTNDEIIIDVPVK
ncbi:hypothetical protein NHF50_05735 [Flavobacterium sp. NRK F10]|uniref:hypothetical protein n=1 Tax=Flavobacterium sp. NRK F10 TaxID=2954931 RepID=UPI002090DD5D|nr:hypothetical protein [Flavobacterium sp. NRK F10]MCO6174539.1 hypothetical protein [Flavobacterium sp. NRK F10]